MRGLSILVLPLAIAISGCSAGLTSRKPILESRDSDSIDEWVGYVGCDVLNNDPKRPTIPILVENSSSGILFIKDYVYTLKILGSMNPEGKVMSLRVKKGGKQSYATQVRGPDDPPEYRYSFAVNGPSGVDIYFTNDERNLSPETKSVLAEVFLNAKDRKSILLSDDFVRAKGKRLIEAIAQSAPKADLSDRASLSCRKVSIDEAKSLVDRMREK